MSSPTLHTEMQQTLHTECSTTADLFCLSLENRRAIYREVFSGQTLIIDTPLSLSERRYSRLLPKDIKRQLPRLLSTCWQLRNESLPIFAETLLYSSRIDIAPIITEYYLNYVKKLYVSNDGQYDPPISRMPHLQTVILEYRTAGFPDVQYCFTHAVYEGFTMHDEYLKE